MDCLPTGAAPKRLTLSLFTFSSQSQYQEPPWLPKADVALVQTAVAQGLQAARWTPVSQELLLGVFHRWHLELLNKVHDDSQALHWMPSMHVLEEYQF